MADAKSKYILEAEDRTGKAFNSVRDRARSVASGVATAGLAAGAAIAASAVSIINSNRQSIDVLAKTGDQLGINTEKLIGLQHAAAQTAGMTEDQFNKSLQTMVKGLSEASVGTGEAKDAIEQLGLSAAELNSMSPDQAMYAISDAMAGVSNQGDRVRIAMKLFGEEGSKLVNTLGSGSELLREYQTEAEALGIALNRIDAAQVEAANDSIDRATKVATGFGQALTVAAAPAIEGVANLFVEAATEAGGFGTIATNAVGAVVKAVGYAGNVVRGLQVAFLGVWNVVKGGAVAVINIFSKVVEGWTQLANLLPGIEVDFDKTFLGQLTEQINTNYAASLQNLHDLAMEPMPLEQVETWFAEVQERSRSHAEQMVAINSQKNNALLANDISLTQRQKELQAKAAAESLRKDQQIFTTTLKNAASSSRALFNLNKAFEIGKGILSLKSTIMSSFNFGASIGGPVLGAAFAAVGGAAQLANLASLKSASFGGSGGGGSGGGSGTVPSTASLLQNQQESALSSNASARPTIPNITLNIEDDDIVSGRTMRRFVERLTDGLRRGEFEGLQTT